MSLGVRVRGVFGTALMIDCCCWVGPWAVSMFVFGFLGFGDVWSFLYHEAYEINDYLIFASSFLLRNGDMCCRHIRER